MKPKQSAGSERGVSALEFTIIAPMLFVLIFGIVEFSFLFYDKAVITNASREGARAGIVAQSPRVTEAEIDQVVLAYAQNHLITFGGGTLTADDCDPVWEGMSFGDDLTVTVTYQYDFLILPNFGPLGWGSLSNPITIQAVTVMRLE